MNKLTIALLATLSFSAFADVTVTTCNSLRNTNHELTLIIANKELKQVRIQAAEGRSIPRAFIPNKVSTQESTGLTIYSLAGIAGIMELETKVLSGEKGTASLLNDEFMCEEN